MRFWVSWYMAGAFTLHGPWWISGARWTTAHDGEDIEQSIVCAAVVAPNEAEARKLIEAAHDDDHGPASGLPIEWRFVEPRPEDWQPFTDRFPRRDWMRWPWPEEVTHG